MIEKGKFGVFWGGGGIVWSMVVLCLIVMGNSGVLGGRVWVWEEGMMKKEWGFGFWF